MLFLVVAVGVAGTMHASAQEPPAAASAASTSPPAASAPPPAASAPAPAASAPPPAASAPPPAESAPAPAAEPTTASREAPPRTAEQAAQGMTSATDEWGRNLKPFGPGIPVRVTSSGKHTSLAVYVARAVELRYRPTDYEFVKVGKTPIEFELPPGQNYFLEVESPEVSRGTLLLRMGSEPKHIEVSPGKAGIRDLGTLSLAIGISATVAGALVFATGTKAKTDFNEAAVAVPLLAVGGSGIILGIVAYRVSRTRLTDPDDPTEQAATGFERAVPIGASFTTRF